MKVRESRTAFYVCNKKNKSPYAPVSGGLAPRRNATT